MNVWPVLAALLVLSGCSEEAEPQARHSPAATARPPQPSPPMPPPARPEAKPDRSGPADANTQKRLDSITNRLEYMQRYIGLPADEH